MAIVKITKTGKQIQFVDEQGRVFGTSTVFMQGLLMGKSKSGFVLLSRLPFNLAPDRFKKSEIWDPQGIWQGDAAKTLEPGYDGEVLTTTNDAFSVNAKKEKDGVNYDYDI